MKRKFLSTLLCAGLVASLAVGCGSGSDGASDDKGGDKLVYWSMWSEEEPQAKVIAEATKNFTEETGIEVDVQFKGRNGQREGLQPALDAGQKIDIFDEDVNRVNGAWSKYLLDLEDLAKDYEAEHGNETLFSIARNAGGGTLKTIPYQPSIFGFFYNKTLFKEAGIETVPTTWAELDAACAKLVEAGITPITGDDAYMTPYIGIHLAKYLGQDGVKALVGDPAVADKVESGEIAPVEWSDERVVAAVDAIADFVEKGYYSKNITTNAFPAGQNQEFAAGEAAMIICGSWLPNEVKALASEDLEWGYFNYPSVEGGAEDNTYNNIANQVFAINKDCKKAEDAFKYIEYLTTGDVDMQFVENAVSIPVDKANADKWPEALADVKEDFDATVSSYDWAAGVENNNDVTPILKDSILKVYGGKLDAAGFVQAMEDATK